jgi:hypothetical protein
MIVNKDIDREILKRVGDENVLRISGISRKMRNEVCDDKFISYLLKKYDVEKYRKGGTMKKFFAKVQYYIEHMKYTYDFEYIGGNFRKQYELLEDYCYNKDQLLVESARSGELSLVKFSRYDISEVDSVAEAITFAVENNNIEIVKYLIETCPQFIYCYENYPLRAACERGYLELVKYLVENGADINALEGNPLRKACENNHLPVVQYLIASGADIHARQDLALREAAKRNYFDIVKFLLSSGGDVHAKNDIIFSFINDEEMLKILRT